MKRFVRLSYTIAEATPLYPKTPAVKIGVDKGISKGDSCNTFLITLSNHTGTHIDAPNHFHSSGKKISDYSLNELFFKRPCVLDCPKAGDEPIGLNDLSGKMQKGTDLLLIRTGFYKIRGTETYTTKNPYIPPETAIWLRTSCPSLRAIGIDCISVASPLHREMGRETHRILLGENTEFKCPPLLIIEDIDLGVDLLNLSEVMAVPLYIEGIDSSPCTLIGIIYD